jgi:2-C-methyl-D-erythritol 4-phosphate cytidylyltransferase/2-C-methyl-D-erythritol 2,4-cyclodiphosphate synthase
MRVVAAVLAAGKGERFGGDKVLADLGGKPVWRSCFDTLIHHPEVDGVGIVASSSNLAAFAGTEAAFVVEGGDNRQESSLRAVQAAEADIVLLQDAARPFLTHDVISRVMEGIARSGAAAPAAPVPDTLRLATGGGYELIDRTKTVAMQTPQGARRDLLLSAHAKADRIYTDEIALLEAIGAKYEIVEGDPENFKITTAADLVRARAKVRGVETRTGIGYDIHPFSSDPARRLMLGGVAFESCTGLEGHSDADVVLHAVVDALLGAAALGDIGQHFPNTDERWRGEPSITFLHHAGSLLAQNGWTVVNLDITMIGEKPKVMPRALDVRSSIAQALGVDVGRVSFKATTNEGLGSLGRGEGIAAHAVATITTAK